MRSWVTTKNIVNPFIVALAFIFLMQNMHAQSVCNDSSENKKAQSFFREALKATKEDKKTDLALYKKALTVDTSLTAAWYILGEIYHKKAIQSQYDILLHQHAGFYFKKAEECFNHVIYQCPDYNDYATYYYLGENYYLQKEYSLASYFLKTFLDNSMNKWPVNNQAELYCKNYQQWKNWQTNPYPVNFVPVSGISTQSDELLPFVSHSGAVFFYKRRMEKPQKNTLYKVVVEEYYQSKISGVDSNDNLQYSEGNLLDWPFESEIEIKEIALSNSNNQLFATHLIKSKIHNQYKYDCDIYSMLFNGDYWEDEKKMPYPINDTTWDGHASISADGKHLYFSSSRSGGFGGKDIYCSVKDSMENWTKPENLGPEINTINDEITPFMHYDGKTLYFSSNGVFGLGGFDIFRSKKTATNHWSKAKNMGKPINSASDDLGLVMDARGNKAYIASNRMVGMGGWDIFSIDIPTDLRPEPYQIICGKILEKNEIPLPNLSISINSIKEEKVWVPTYNTFDGSFYVILPKSDETYLLKINTENYNYSNLLICFDAGKSCKYLALTLDKISHQKVFPLNNILINNDLSLDTKSLYLLNDFAEYLYKNQDLIIEFLISPCSKKLDENAQVKCQKFGTELIDKLVNKGIEKQRLSFTIDYKLNKEPGIIPIFIKATKK
jgi:hypothetical protein